MTTDRSPKRVHRARRRRDRSPPRPRAAGMIQPGFATMLCFVQTDAAVDDPDADLRGGGRGLVRADHGRRPDVAPTTPSLLQASGDRPAQPLPGRPARRGPARSWRSRSSPTARARRGSGGSRSHGGRDADEAERVARAIANSPLVKTALHGRDPNWGRIAQAAGMALAGEELRGARARARSTPRSSARETRRGRRSRVRLGPRRAPRADVYFSDLSHEYVRDQRGVHDMSSDRSDAGRTQRRGRRSAASRRCSRRCRTSGSSTAARS